MKVTIKCRSSRVEMVEELMEECGLWPREEAAYNAATNSLEVDFLTDTLYRDVDRFLDHAQAVMLIRDWQIAR